jgi:hypothetical protein
MVLSIIAGLYALRCPMPALYHKAIEPVVYHMTRWYLWPRSEVSTREELRVFYRMARICRFLSGFLSVLLVGTIIIALAGGWGRKEAEGK